jgi:acetyl/propionyl-CoA carboxylase alpha subunit
MRRFEIPHLPGVRVDAGVRDGGLVSVYYDPMLAKVIAHAPTREQAARLLARALAESRLHGVVTNRDLLTGILREQEFLDGRIDTGYLTRHDPAELMAADPRRDPLHALAVALADQAARRSETPVLGSVPSGWRNVPNGPQQISYQTGGRTIPVEYRVSRDRAEAVVDGAAFTPVLLYACTPGLVDIQVDGVRRQVSIDREGPVRYADSALGATTLTELPRFPEADPQATAGSLAAPMPGTVIRVEARPGEAVHLGQVLVVLEAMKMEHSVRAPHGGTLAELRVSAGQSVDQGTVLVVLDTEAGTSEGGTSEGGAGD